MAQTINRLKVHHSWLFIFLLILICCDSKDEVRYPEGKKIAERICVSCHNFAEPEALSRDLWEQILPRMGARLGINFSQQEAGYLHALRQVNLAPDSPVISMEEWQKIQAYYLSNSPDSLPRFRTKIDEKGLSLFTPRLIELTDNPPAASLVKFDSTGFWYGDALANRLYYLNLLTSESSSLEISGSPSDMVLRDDGIILLSMGNIFPNDDYSGKLELISDDSVKNTLIDSLNRPVKFLYTDLNNDSVKDYLICEFGHLSGSLSWFEVTDNGLKRHTLKNEPGALNAETVDLNKDGHMDIIALMAQGREGIYAFLGNGRGDFVEHKLLEFPSYYGSSYLELKDMNGDGRIDIIYANGDTGDYSYPALKPYHAVRIFLQEESMTFKESFTFPIHGPFNTMAEDYDLDGDIDLAVTSYFPDFENTPEEGFVFLENQGGLIFIARSFPEATWGNWLTADRSDIDGDGDIDLILGNGPVIRSKVNPKISRLWQAHPNSVLLLENNKINSND